MAIEERGIGEIAAAWIALHRLAEASPEREALFWAFCSAHELVLEDPEKAWEMIEEIRRLDGSDLILSNLAAGPLEDLLVAHGERFVDRIEATCRRDQQFRKVLGATWRNGMADALWAHIRAVAAPSW
ncbi:MULTISPECIES: DUF6869 domain-containing protein [Stenotrophomonas]|uniref:DUF6869 domain-containing protein n=1 Tax=Stenotrophomonas TaxID=40323 RepID=UPI0008733AAF|nr:MULTISPECIES: hypothetical protein [Stenotrophomonas]OEZ01261.1 hypothetical protein BIY45_07455 [Stenotrophomonas sp. BIIR7]